MGMKFSSIEMKLPFCPDRQKVLQHHPDKQQASGGGAVGGAGGGETGDDFFKCIKIGEG